MPNIKNLEQVYCSLNLGLIYSVSFDFDPENGSRITVVFVNDSGVYDTDFLSAIVPASIGIGEAKFQMYPVSYNYQQDSGRKVIAVNFIDDFHKLNNYFIVLGKRGCGPNTFSLGVPILELTAEFKLSSQQRQIRDLTQIFDLEYPFSDFINVLQQIFPVIVSPAATAIAGASVATGLPGDNPNINVITRNFTGSFKEVLDAWCSFLDLFYFIENGKINIFASVDFSLQFPDRPDDAISFSQTESLENTYSKTASFYFEDEGGETTIPELKDVGGAASLNKGKTSSDAADAAQADNSINYSVYLTMYPYNASFAFSGLDNLTTEPDFQQCIAASYGEEFWFLYNYYNAIGKTIIQVGQSLNEDGSVNQTSGFQASYYPEIGLTTVARNDILAGGQISFLISMETLKADGLCSINQETFSKNFNKYLQYGREKAGRFYMTFEQSNVDYYDQFTFVSPEISDKDGQSFIDKPVFQLQKFIAPVTTLFDTQNNDSFDPIPGILPNSQVPGFDGLAAIGNRLIYFDNSVVDYNTIFALTPVQIDSLSLFFNQISHGISSSNNFPTSFLGAGNWVAYVSPSPLIFIDETMNSFLANPPALVPKFGNNVSFTGYTKINNLNIAKTNAVPAGQKKNTNKTNTAGADDVNITNNTQINNARQSTNQKISVSSGDQITTITSIGGATQQTLHPIAYFSKLQKCSSSSQAVGSNVLNHRFLAKQISVDTPLEVKTIFTGSTYKVSRDTAFINDLRWQSLLTLLSQPRTFTDKSISFSTNYFYNVPRDFITNGLTSMSVEVDSGGLTATYTFSNKMMIVPNYESQEAKIERAIKQSAISQYNAFARFNNLAEI